jgi:hypothetical protein
MAKKTKKYSKVVNVASVESSLFRTPQGSANDLWRWGADNLFPVRIERLARANATHRGIIQSKSRYLSGSGFVFDDKNAKLARIVSRANGKESLAQVIGKVIKDKVLFGNAFIEVVIVRGELVLFHQDATRCRVSKPTKDAEERIIISKDWEAHQSTYDKSLPIFPRFELREDKTMRSIVHIKDYEPMFEHYGVPSYIAGLTSARIGAKTGQWNESRLDNSFQLSGVLELVSPEDNEDALNQTVKAVTEKFGGSSKAGQVLVSVANEEGGAKFTPIQAGNDGDWRDLHESSSEDLVIAHSWYMALAGLNYTSGFSADRILHEYKVALNTVILPEQEEILDILNAILRKAGVDGSSLEFQNLPPIAEKPIYMKVWEARKADGLQYDENDPAQQVFIANITKVDNNA